MCTEPLNTERREIKITNVGIFNVTQVVEITIMKGIFGALHGLALGGVVCIQTSGGDDLGLFLLQLVMVLLGLRKLGGLGGKEMS